MTPTEDPAVVAARLDKYDQKAATCIRQMQAEHEAFRREVSEACSELLIPEDDLAREFVRRRVSRFIIKPVDPLGEVFREVTGRNAEEGEEWAVAIARSFREVAIRRGGKIVFEEQAR